MPSVRNLKTTIGGPEITPGTAVARESVVPIRALPGLDKSVERAEDPAIIGSNMVVGEYAVADSVEGPLPISMRVSDAIGKITYGALGDYSTEGTAVQIAAAIRLRFTGTEASAKITAATTADELRSFIGVKGAEAGDTNFGTTGVIDLTDVATDTVGELVTEIDGYTDYDCEKVFGDDAVDAGEIVGTARDRQGKDTWVYLFFAGAATAVYWHEIIPDLTDTEKPTWTIQNDGYTEQFTRPGCVIDTFGLNGTLKAMPEGEVGIMGFGETEGDAASVLNLEAVEPLIFHKGSATIGEVEYTFVRTFGLEIANNHNSDAGYGMGSISRTAHEKGEFGVTGTIQLRLDANSFLERAKVASGVTVSIVLDMYAEDLVASGGAGDTGIQARYLIEIPYATISSFTFLENGPIVDCQMEFKALNPAGTLYNPPMAIHMISGDSAQYDT